MITQQDKVKIFVHIMEGVFCGLHPFLDKKTRRLNESKEDKKLDYKKATNVLKAAVEKLDRSVVRPSILENKIKKDEYGTDTFTLCGGLNGGGNYTKWTGYFEELSKFVIEVSKSYDIWLIKLKNDCIDDVFYAEFGIQEISEDNDK